MGVHHALGTAGRPRGVAQRYRIPLIVGQFPVEPRIASRQKIIVFGFAGGTRPARRGIRDEHEPRRRPQTGECVGKHATEIRIRQ